MILIAASTIGLALIGKEGPTVLGRLIRGLDGYFHDPNFVTNNITLYPWQQVEYIVAFFLPLLSALTLALAAIHIQPPRPSLARLVWRPGASACLIASAALILECGTAWLFYRFWPNGYVYGIGIWGYVLGLEGFRFVASRVSLAVGAAWLMQGIGGRWRPEPTWIDRAGRVIGFVWVALIPLYNWSIVR